MTRASALLSQIYEDANPAADVSGTANNNNDQINIDMVSAMADVLQDIVDNLDDDQLDEVSPLIEGVLDEVDPDGELDVADAVCLLPIDAAQGLYDAVTAWCNTRGIDFDDSEVTDGEDDEDDGDYDFGLGDDEMDNAGPQGTGSIG